MCLVFCSTLAALVSVISVLGSQILRSLRGLVFLLWVEPGDEYMNEEPVEYANEEQAFDNSENSAGKMTFTLLVVRSIALLCYLSPVYQAIPNCHEPLTFDTFPMQTVVWLCYRFCSAPLIALLVAGEVEDFSMVDRILVGISQYLLYY